MKKIVVSLLRIMTLCGLCAALLGGWMLLEHSHTVHEAEFVFVGTQHDADCCIMLSDGRCVMVDTGEATDAPHILKVLQEKEVMRIDCMILTHPDQDHVGGASALLDTLPVSQIIVPYFSGEKATYQKLMDKVEKLHIPVLTLPRDRQFIYGDLNLRVFPPNEFFYEKSNDYSLAALVKHDEVSLFLAGDAEKVRLKEVLELRLPSPIQLYKTAHHGRNSTKGAELIEKLSPEYAIVTAIAPEKEIKTAFQKTGTIVYNTVGQDVGFVSDGTMLKPLSAKQIPK